MILEHRPGIGMTVLFGSYARGDWWEAKKIKTGILYALDLLAKIGRLLFACRSNKELQGRPQHKRKKLCRILDLPSYSQHFYSALAWD
jgi:predicted nucleotidyltransferase